VSRHAERLDKLRHALRQEALDLLLVSEGGNVTYLTGFRGDSAYLLLDQGHAWLIADGRYTEQAAAEAPQCEVVRQTASLVKSSAELANASGGKTLGFEPNVLTVATHGDLTKELQGVEAVPKKGLVEKQRQVKDEEEIERIRAAVALADAAFRSVVGGVSIVGGVATRRVSRDGDIPPTGGLAAGVSEAQVANHLEYEMRRLGARKPSFESIVAARQRSSLPHAQATHAAIGAGDPVLIDWGAELDLYCSDCTRMAFLGAPDARWREIYEIVREAQALAIAAIRAGVAGRDVDAAARTHITQSGYGDAFKHGLGHGVGLRVHEGPTLSARSEDTLAEGMVVTVEPGIYIAGWGGVRIEDLVVVRSDGPEVLSSLPKALEAAIL